MTEELIVPYNDRQEVESLGATKVKGKTNRYSLPVSDEVNLLPFGADSATIKKFSKWYHQQLPWEIFGEDRNYSNILIPKMIPKSSWYNNVRAAVDDVQWELVKELAVSRAHYRCEYCGQSPNYPRKIYLEAHELFDFTERTGNSGQIVRNQTLTRIACICTECHQSIHFGKANVDGIADKALNHLITVNNWQLARGIKVINKAIDTWEERSNYEWNVDISIISNHLEKYFTNGDVEPTLTAIPFPL
ncbi:hypothetical protein [Pseudolactococcus insecticola]|uniref:HNH endonuclease n=1 Tax=Pseudolactococcus insecticola TaxID=2709158 RepID=A0A6A0B9L0_9LACT|nr:hypothetical protein [Lactococcus insecticola]GFH41405.1 hypothetical protein Hs20B_18030 [Lactococcus insecticola]